MTSQAKTDPAMAGMTTITSYAEVEEVFRSKNAAPGWGQGENAPFRAATLTALEGSDHFERRRIESILFRKEALVAYDRDALMPAIKRGLEDCTRRLEPDGKMRADLPQLVRPMFIAVSAAIAGIDGLDDLEAAKAFISDAELISEGSHVQWSQRDHATVLREADEAKRRYVERHFAPSWARRKAQAADFRASGEKGPLPPKDVLTLMIEHADHFGKWDADLAVRETLMFLTGGLFSPTYALAHVVTELSGWLKRNPQRRDDLDDLEFLRQAVTEAIRLHPPGPPKHRKILQDMVLSTGRKLSEGEHVLLDIARASRDPAVFGADADTFRVPRTPVGRAQPFGMVFGGGAHTCIGRGLATGETIAGAPPGSLVRILHELYRAGMHPDPDRPPKRKPGNAQGNYETFPVRFDLL